MAEKISFQKVTAEYLRCDWHTIMRCISRARSVLEPDIKKRYDGLVNIGIDETSYRKGHNYVTTVVNHDTNSIVWCAPGHSTEVLSKFFEELTDEQRKNIQSVSGDGAKWIDECIREYCPNANRCVDPFHVIEWAMEALDAWFKWARHCRIPAFVKLQKKINRHMQSILNTIEYGLTNARIEAINNKIKLSIRMAYGFRNIDNMMAMIMLRCSDIKVQLPWEKDE